VLVMVSSGDSMSAPICSATRSMSHLGISELPKWWMLGLPDKVFTST